MSMYFNKIIRYAKKSTIDELKTKLKKYVEFYDFKDEECIDICDVYEDLPDSDITVQFDLENCYTPYDSGGDITNFYQLDDFAIMMCLAGGDWEQPVAFCIYLDDCDELRMYVPIKGNVFNTYTMTAFGSEHYAENYLYKMPDNWFEDPSHRIVDDTENYSDEYYTHKCAEFDIDSMLEDIKNNIIVKN